MRCCVSAAGAGPSRKKRRKPSVHTFCAVILLLSVEHTSGQHSPNHLERPPARFRCQPVGLCEPCPPAATDLPACLPFSNRRALSCVAVLPVPTGGPELSASDLSEISLEQRPGSMDSTAIAKGLQSINEAHIVDEDDTALEEATINRLKSPQRTRHMLKSALFTHEQQENQTWARRRRKIFRFLRRDLFWEGSETSAKHAVEVMRNIDWDAIRLDEAREQGIASVGDPFQSWSPCARILAKEKSDFGEFIVCNVLFAFVSLAVLFFRHRKLAARQYIKLAARIGIPTSMGIV